MFFSRNSNDVTPLYGPKLTSEVKKALFDSVDSCVLDGEVIVWDLEKDVAAPFGKNKPIANEQFNDPFMEKP